MKYRSNWFDDILDDLPEEKLQFIKECCERQWRTRQKLMHKIEIKQAQEDYEV